MKRTTIAIISVLAIVLASCGSSKSMSGAKDDIKGKDESSYVFVGRVNDNACAAQSLQSSIDLSISGISGFSLGGKVRMKRDEVIRINVTAMGLMEVAVMEFTPEYAMIVDRIHSSYVKESYNNIDFLKKNGISFYSLQALFWNELFCPGEKKVTESMLRNFTADLTSADKGVISIAQGDLNYQWTADKKSANIEKASMCFANSKNGAASLNWTYGGFTKVAGKMFPLKHTFNLFGSALGGHNATMTIEMTTPEIGKNFDTHTTLSSKYKQVDAETLMKQFMK